MLVILLIFLLCACACSVGHGVAFSSYMLACMMFIMVLLYVPWCLCTQWWSWSCSHLTQISLLSSFLLAWMVLVMVLFFFLLCCSYFPLAFPIYVGKRLLLICPLTCPNAIWNIIVKCSKFFLLFHFLFFPMCFYFNLCFQFCFFVLILDYF